MNLKKIKLRINMLFPLLLNSIYSPPHIVLSNAQDLLITLRKKRERKQNKQKDKNQQSTKIQFFSLSDG